MRVPRRWLAEFVELPASLAELTALLDDVGLVVEEVVHRGEGLEDVIVARVEEIRAIPGADRVRLVIANVGGSTREIVCGATNFAVGNFVPFAPVGAVLPGGFTIAERKMRGVTSYGMLCSGRELGISEDHEGLMILDASRDVREGMKLTDLLGLTPDVTLVISPEGNRPDAWSVEGVARDIAARRNTPLAYADIAEPGGPDATTSFASAAISSPELCGSLTVGVVRHVTVTDSPSWLRQRLSDAGVRSVNNVVDASNYVMLELGQPTHPYDAALVSGRHLGVRAARDGEVIATLDGDERTLGRPGRGLGDTGVDCVIVDADDAIIGLAGVMGGEASAITNATTDVLLEAAFFDPMTIARTSKRLGLRTEASSRFERGVDPTLGPRAIARIVALIQLTSPDAVWLRDPVVITGRVPVLPTLTVSAQDIETLLGTAIDLSDAAAYLAALNFSVTTTPEGLRVTPPPSRLDVRDGLAGRADVIEEIARLYSYQRLARRTPTWTTPGSLSNRQQFRRTVRDAIVGLGFLEAWTETFVSDSDFDLVSPTPLRVRVTNPHAEEFANLRSSLLVGLSRAWGRNVERGNGDVGLFEFGTVVEHPGWSEHPRKTRGGAGGVDKMELPAEHENVLILLGRKSDDARTAVATWSVLASRWGLADIAVRSGAPPRGWHPTRGAALVSRSTNERLGWVGELDPALVAQFAPSVSASQRVGLIELDLDVLSDAARVPRRSGPVAMPTRFPSATIDLAFVAPHEVSAGDIAAVLRASDERVEDVTLFDVYRGEHFGADARSVAFTVRLSSPTHTLSESDVSTSRAGLIAAVELLGCQLR